MSKSSVKKWAAATKHFRFMSYCESCQITYDPILQEFAHPHRPLNAQRTSEAVARLRQEKRNG